MKRFSYWIVVLSILCLTLSGCTREDCGITEADTNLLYDSAPRLSSSSVTQESSVILNGWTVQFNGRVYENDATTFYYTVSFFDREWQLTSFWLEIPECAPEVIGFSPEGGWIGINPDNQIYGIKWELYPGIEETIDFYVTYAGDVPLGLIRTATTVRSPYEEGDIPGPCDRVVEYEVSGFVYVDSDSNGVYDETDEEGIENVTVALVSEVGVETVITDADGFYSFMATTGIYSIGIPAETAAEDFNEDLVASFAPTGPEPVSITLVADMPGVNFGYDPRTEEITEKLDEGFIETNGEDFKFWRRQIRAAMHTIKFAGTDSGPTPMYDAEAMSQIFTDLQGFFIPRPFQLTQGMEFEEALEILHPRHKENILILRRELFTAELNHVTGRGMIGSLKLQAIMLAWAESVVFDAVAGGSSQILSPAGRDMLGAGLIDDRVVDAIDFLTSLNSNIGGGSGGGG